jgi:hypothetical protein
MKLMSVGFLAILCIVAAFVAAPSTPARADCCAELCCDCGCVSLRAQQNADRIARLLGRKNGVSVQSFRVDVSKQKLIAKWTCRPTESGAQCTRD